MKLLKRLSVARRLSWLATRLKLRRRQLGEWKKSPVRCRSRQWAQTGVQTSLQWWDAWLIHVAKASISSLFMWMYVWMVHTDIPCELCACMAALTQHAISHLVSLIYIRLYKSWYLCNPKCTGIRTHILTHECMSTGGAGLPCRTQCIQDRGQQTASHVGHWTCSGLYALYAWTFMWICTNKELQTNYVVRWWIHVGVVLCTSICRHWYAWVVYTRTYVCMACMCRYLHVFNHACRTDT